MTASGQMARMRSRLGASRAAQPQKANFCMKVTLSGRAMDLRVVQFSKGLSWMAVRLAGCVTKVRALQPSKVYCSRVTTPSGMVMAVNDLHEQKDLCASLVRDVGRTTAVRASQPANALPPMVVHESSRSFHSQR